jgi:hypothetical protein
VSALLLENGRLGVDELPPARPLPDELLPLVSAA